MVHIGEGLVYGGAWSFRHSLRNRERRVRGGYGKAQHWLHTVFERFMCVSKGHPGLQKATSCYRRAIGLATNRNARRRQTLPCSVCFPTHSLLARPSHHWASLASLATTLTCPRRAYLAPASRPDVVQTGALTPRCERLLMLAGDAKPSMGVS